MKQKIKLWILRMEGWKQISGMNKFYKKFEYLSPSGRAVNMSDIHHSLDSAWWVQFGGGLKDYLKTKLFWLVFTMIVGALFFLFDDNSTVIENGISWFSWVGTIFFMYPLGWTLIAIAYMVWHGIKKLFNIK